MAELQPANASWHRFLPRAVRDRLDGRHGLQAVLSNSSWMFGDKILRMIMGLLVGVWTVRYLGPTQLGLLNFSGAFAGLFAAFATLGLDSLVVRDLVHEPSRQNTLLGTAFVMKLVAGTLSVLAAVVAIAIVRPGETLTLYIVLLSSAIYIFQSLFVIDFYFQAKVQSKYTVYSTTSAFLVISAVKVTLLVTNASLLAFAWAGLAEFILGSMFLVVAFRANHQSLKLWSFDKTVAWTLLRHCWPLILSGLAIMIYMRIDQVMIGQMLGDHDVGLFSAAVRISEMWYFVPLALASSVFPAIIASKKLGEAIYYERLQKFFTLMTWLGLIVAIVVSLARNWITHLLYGDAYAASASVLGIHIWAGVFVASGVASSGWFIVEHLQKIAFYRALGGGFVNVALNFVLIPRYGIEGAATATVISQGLASIVFDVVNPKTRPIFWMKLKAFDPMRLLTLRG